ncbi:unnamed protein product, partial [Iphiclides podalirius]
MDLLRLFLNLFSGVSDCTKSIAQSSQEAQEPVDLVSGYTAQDFSVAKTRSTVHGSINTSLLQSSPTDTKQTPLPLDSTSFAEKRERDATSINQSGHNELTGACLTQQTNSVWVPFTQPTTMRKGGPGV